MDTDYFLFLLIFCCRDDDWSNDDSDLDLDNMYEHNEYSHSEIINRCNFGLSKDAIIVSSWPTGSLAAMFKNWEYVVLSRVRTLSGLYLVKPIDMDKSFQPSPQLASYMDKIRKFEKDMLEKRQQAISKTFSN